MFSDLLKPEYGIDDSPQDGTRITQVILYFDLPDVLELKKLAKDAMKKVWPETYDKDGNLSMLFLELLKRFENEGHRIPTPTGVIERSEKQESTTDESGALFF